jgi:hypothetical protein
MIAARAQELTALIDRRAVLRKHVDQLDAFQGREQKLAVLVEAMRPLSEAVKELRRRNLAAIDVEERLAGVLSQLQRVEAVYREQREAFVDAQRSGFADFERTLNAFSSLLSTQVQEAWRTYTRDRAQPLDPEVLRVLGSIAAYSGSIRRLQALDRLVSDLRETLPSQDVCERFERAADDRNAIWEEMRGADFSNEILDFLRKASGGGAAIDDFTPGVESWITNHKLRGSFRITMANRGGG